MPISSFVHSSIEDLHSYTIIVACVGVGNVPQLTCDLLIHNLKFDHIGDLNFQFVPAVVGLDPYHKPGTASHCLMTATQLYVNRKLKICILQLRSPPFQNCQKKHIQELTDFLYGLKFVKIILLSSSYATVRKDAELQSIPLQYVFSKSPNHFNRKYFEESSILTLTPELDENHENGQSKQRYHLPGCGIANKLFEKLCSFKCFSVCLLNYFTSEGDNSSDALCVVQHLDHFLHLTQSAEHQWSPPISWSMLYGCDALDSLY